MIASDQPTIFGKDVIAAVSSVSDGNMRFGQGDDRSVAESRQGFLEKTGIHIKDTTLIRVTFKDVEQFARYQVVDDDQKGNGMTEPQPEAPADALVVTKPGHALFLLLADCVGVIIYDERQRVLMVSHIGRHSAEIEGARRSIEYLQQQFATNPHDVKVWLSLAVGKSTYPLYALGNKGLQEVIVEQLAGAGVPSEHIEISSIDTAQNTDYFSHSQFLAGKRLIDGRFAIVAQMDAQGEPAS